MVRARRRFPMDIEGALTYPTNDDDWVKTVGIGGLILLIPGALSLLIAILGVLTFGVGFVLMIFVLPIQLLASAFVFGYYIDVIRETIRGNDMPPRFEDWGRLGKDGAMGLVIGIVYQLPLLLIFGVAVGAMFLFFGAGAATGSENAAAGLSLVGFLAFFAIVAVSLVYSLAAGYFLPISLCAYAHEGDLGAAFSTDRLKQVGTASEYVIAWVVAVGGMLVLSQVLQFLIFVLVGFFVQFYIYVALARLVAEAYAESLDVEGVHEGPSTEASGWVDDGSAPGDA